MTAMIKEGRVSLPQALPCAEPALFERTVPRQLVHRASVSEVFVTDLGTLGSDTFHVAAQWPRARCYFGPTSTSRHDSMLLPETMRQAGLAIAHRFYGVPQGFSFVFHEISFDTTEDAFRLNGRPADMMLMATCRDIRRRSGNLGGMRVCFTIYRDGVWVGTGEGRLSCVSDAAYARLRSGRSISPPAPLPTPVAPSAVRRDRAEDVVLSAVDRDVDGDHTWALRVDRSHPVIFDHPVDHVPGMVALEAARQAALLELDRPDALPIACDFAFARYIELDERCLVYAHPQLAPTGLGRVRVRLEQCGHTAAQGSIELRLPG